MTNEKNCFNLRAFIYACQKVIDMFDNVDMSTIDYDFLERVFVGTVSFCLTKSKTTDVIWTDSNDTSFSLGAKSYPLYRFAYNYIMYQRFDRQELINASKRFLKEKKEKTDAKKTDKNLRVLYECYLNKEQDVMNAIIYVYGQIKNKENTIPKNQYLRIANYLFFIKYCIDGFNDPDDYIQKTLDVISNSFDESSSEEDVNYYSGIMISSEEGNLKFNEYLNNIKNKINPIYCLGSKIEYSFDAFMELIEQAKKSGTRYLDRKGFVKFFDAEQIVNLILMCDARQVEQVRSAFSSVYHFSNLKDYFSEDLTNLEKIYVGLSESVLSNKIKDSITRNSINWFINDLNKYINNIKGNDYF